MIASTNITPLAVTLSTLGVPFADEKNPDWLCYTPEILSKAGCKTAEEAQQRGVPGIRQYSFADHAERDECMKKFTEGFNGKPGREELPDIPAPMLAYFAGLLFRNRRTFMAGQKITPAKMMFRRDDGSYAVVGKNAKPEDLRHLGLQ
jgi:hypothetical protein